MTHHTSKPSEGTRGVSVIDIKMLRKKERERQNKRKKKRKNERNKGMQQL